MNTKLSECITKKNHGVLAQKNDFFTFFLAMPNWSGFKEFSDEFQLKNFRLIYHNSADFTESPVSVLSNCEGHCLNSRR